MATLYIAEFNAVGGSGNFPFPAAQVPPIAEQTVAIGVSSTPCNNAFQASTRLIRLETDVSCSVAFGTNPVATTAKMRLAPNQTEYFSVPAGANYKVAVISN